MKVWIVVGNYSDGQGDSGRPHCFGVFTSISSAQQCASEKRMWSASVACFRVDDSNAGPWDSKYQTMMRSEEVHDATE